MFKEMTRIGLPLASNRPLWGFWLLLVLVSGCGEAVPELETWPVHGTVVDQKGQPVTSGAIRFMTDSDAYLNTTGAIEPDGSFTMRSLRRGFEYKGAVAGAYQVIVLFEKTGADGRPFPAQYQLPKPYTVEPKENEFAVKIRR